MKLCFADGVDYTGESTDVTYFSPIEEVIICENIAITDDMLGEPIEEFGILLTSTDPAVSFLTSSGIIIIVDDDGQ